MQSRWRTLGLLTSFLALTSVNWPAGCAVAVSLSSHFAASHGTRIVAVMDTPLNGGTNLVWCGAFQLAWNEACEKLRGPIQLVPPSPLAAVLDRREFDRKCIEEASVFQGVTLHSEAGISFACSAKLEKVSRHVMILQPPFLLLMQRRAAPEPYLACWIANGDLLERK